MGIAGLLFLCSAEKVLACPHRLHIIHATVIEIQRVIVVS
jgi:hypothetical protein